MNETLEKYSRVIYGRYNIGIDYIEAKERTPKTIFNILNNRFHFDYTPVSEDTFKKDWKGKVYICPRYNQQKMFLLKGFEELKNDHISLLVALLPARTDTNINFELVMPNLVNLEFIQGRLRFPGFESSAPFPSMIVAFDKEGLGKFSKDSNPFDCLANAKKLKLRESDKK